MEATSDAVKATMTPEERFLAWKNRPKHPLFSTSSSEYGKIPKGYHLELKPPEAGKGNGEQFSTTFAGMYKNTTLAVSKTKHRYLKELDD